MPAFVWLPLLPIVSGPMKRSPEVDPIEHAAIAHGYTRDVLPALLQYRTARESGNVEAARRIEENLRRFLLSKPKPQEIQNECFQCSPVPRESSRYRS